MSIEGILYLVLDVFLLGALGWFAFKLHSVTDAPAGLDKAPAIIGIVGLIRGLWRCIYLPGTLGYLFGGGGYMDFRSYLFIANGIVADLCLVGLGLLLMHRAAAAQLPQGGARNALENTGAFLYKIKGLLGALAWIAVIITILPHLPAGSGGYRRRRRW